MSDALAAIPAPAPSGEDTPAACGDRPELPTLRVLIVSFYFPPAGGGGVQRPLKFATHLLERGFETHVLAPSDAKWIDRDDEQLLPDELIVHRAPYLGPRGRRPAEELYGLRGPERVLARTRLLGRRLLVPDENVVWAATAITAATRIVRAEGIDVILTTSPPGSVHLIGAAVKRRTGVAWVADLRDPLVAHPHRRVERRLVRVKEHGPAAVQRLVARHADAVVAVSDAIAAELRAADARAVVTTIPSGADFDDFAGLSYSRGQRFRVTHTGSFFGQRDPRPFLLALGQVDGVEARFVGDSRAADREWSRGLDLDGRLEWIPFLPRTRTLELQRDSEALLLLIPEAGGRGDGMLSGKVFEYLAAGRPVIALVPPDGAAARLLRKTGAGPIVAPDDVEGAAAALRDLRDRWDGGNDLEVVSRRRAARAALSDHPGSRARGAPPRPRRVQTGRRDPPTPGRRLRGRPSQRFTFNDSGGMRCPYATKCSKRTRATRKGSAAAASSRSRLRAGSRS
jgi:glycosyltransferase involved in cell wall biosynthesis